jgi:hypothetical protein
MNEKQIADLREHTKTLPCITCLIRPTCVVFYEDGTAVIEQEKVCGVFRNWAETRDKIAPALLGTERGYRGRIITETTLEILKEEKKRNARS